MDDFIEPPNSLVCFFGIVELTIDCRYIAAWYNTILHTAQQIKRYNFSQIKSSRKTSIPHPYGQAMWCLLWVIWSDYTTIYNGLFPLWMEQKRGMCLSSCPISQLQCCIVHSPHFADQYCCIAFAFNHIVSICHYPSTKEVNCLISVIYLIVAYWWHIESWNLTIVGSYNGLSHLALTSTYAD